MASSSSTLRSSSSEEDLRPVTDDRKRKRMLSNRESARRSRMRKQKHLDDLASQISQLTNENHQIMTTLNITTQLLMKVEAENCVLKAQLSELHNRLQSLNEIIEFANTCNYGMGNLGNDQDQNEGCGYDNHRMMSVNDSDYDDMLTMMNPWGGSFYANQRIMANDMIMY